ncbi:MAG: hypothetical protein ABUU24_02270, partial [Variovorax sp.]
HSAIDAALALRAEHGIRPERVKRIRVGINRQAYEAVCTPIEVRKAPRTVVHAQFSLPYTVAAALVDGGVRLGHFERASLGREDILALAQRVDAYVEDDIEREWGRSVTPALLHIEMNDGSTHRLRVDQPLGHPDRPMTSAAMEAKAVDCFRAAARPLRADGAARLRQCVDSLEGCEDVRVLAGILEPAV